MKNKNKNKSGHICICICKCTSSGERLRRWDGGEPTIPADPAYQGLYFGVESVQDRATAAIPSLLRGVLKKKENKRFAT